MGGALFAIPLLATPCLGPSSPWAPCSDTACTLNSYNSARVFPSASMDEGPCRKGTGPAPNNSHSSRFD